MKISIFAPQIVLNLIFSCELRDTTEASVLLDVDREFSKLSEIKGMHYAFETYIADDGVILRNNSYPIEGKCNVVARLRQSSDTSFLLTWEPMFADLAQSGDLGYTYGTYLVSSPAGDSLGAGTYVSIWKKQPDNTWKFVFDAGNEGL